MHPEICNQPPKAITETFSSLDRSFIDLARAEEFEDGAAISSVYALRLQLRLIWPSFIWKEKIYTATCGDVRGLMFSTNSTNSCLLPSLTHFSH
jgi:hypothetical protein